MKHINQLIHESSPYLLQHAHNPVNWMPFGTAAFTRAQLENKPLLISIGYSSCHWCHIMEHESFENEEIATLMNEHFVCVKVDREERPDVDHVYMEAVQQIHGNGGWPLNCFALPDGRPFWGGTYFRPEQWEQLLKNVNELFHNRYPDIENQAIELAEGISRQNYLLSEESGYSIPDCDFNEISIVLQNLFDQEMGGLSGAPKFPMPIVLKFLLYSSLQYNDANALKLVELTLLRMARGGIYDQAGGGFARYSTDREWKVPHFEKMLYDNAQLISLFSEIFQVTGNDFYKKVLSHTIKFVNRELSSPEGVFYSALDADSEGGEGHYYTWTSDEFNQVLGHYAPLAAEYYGINATGLWENGRNILLRPTSDEIFAQQHFLSADELASLTHYCRNELLKARSLRPSPGLDDKILLSWNALMISALVDASISLNRTELLNRAIEAADFIINNFKTSQRGLFHTYKNGKAKINAFLDDYAFTSEAFLSLYTVTAEMKWLNEALYCTDYVIQHFYDSNSGFFWYSENNENLVFTRKIEIYDGVVPSGNSVMADVLNTLGTFMHNQDYLDKSRHMVMMMGKRFSVYPAAYAKWASLALSMQQESFVIAVVGADAVSMISELKKKYLPGVKVFGSITKSDLPFFVGRFVEGKTMIYVCSGSQCLTPVATVEEVVKLL